MEFREGLICVGGIILMIIGMISGIYFGIKGSSLLFGFFTIVTIIGGFLTFYPLHGDT